MKSEYLVLLPWFMLFAVVCYSEVFTRREYVCGVLRRRYPLWWALIIMTPLVYIAAHRTLGDTYYYLHVYKQIPIDFSEFAGYLDQVNKDKGFSVLSWLIKTMVGDNSVWYLGIIAALQALCLTIVYRKYSESFFLSIFLFLASTDFVSWMENGMRQFGAVCVTFLAFKYILDKRYLPAILIILLAATFHATALLMIPFIFIVQGTALNKQTMLFVAMAIFLVFFVSQVTGLLDGLLAETQYGNVITEWQESKNDGVNPLRVLVYSVPSVIAFLGRDTIRKVNNPVINLATNMSLVSMGLYIIGMFTSGIFMGRLPIYFSLYSYILLPWELKYLFPKSDASIIRVIMMAGYAIFGYLMLW